MEIYSQNNIFVKVPEGLCDPFVTTKGVLQGCVNSPIIFNLFIDRISKIFDDSCDPVEIKKN